MYTVRCGKCGWTGHENELEIGWFFDVCIELCPKCQSFDWEKIEDTIFDVGKTDFIDGRWIAGGRAYKDIYVGDLLFAKVIGNDGTHRTSCYKVETILTYGKSTDFLCKVMTGYLYLSGDQDLRTYKRYSLHFEKPSFEIRYRICMEIFEQGCGSVPEPLKNRIKMIKQIDFFDEVTQFNYKYNRAEEIDELVTRFEK